jgi:hypothetical protein
MLGVVGTWWRQTDHYDQLSSHLASRHMAKLTRTAVAVIATSLSITAFATIWSTLGPHNTLQVWCAALGSMGSAIVAVVWAQHWPSRAQAIQLTVLGNASIALAALSQSGPVAAVLACTTFATMASYIALFHTAPLMLYNFLIAAAVGAFEFVRLADR